MNPFLRVFPISLLAALALPAQGPGPSLREPLDVADARWHGATAVLGDSKGGAARFDGVDDHIELGPCGLGSEQSFTLRCRLRTTSARFATALMARDGDAVAASLVLGRQPGVLTFEAWSWREVRLPTLGRIDDGAWHQVEVAYDASTNAAQLRVDGIVQATAELGHGGAPTANLRLGDNVGTAQPFAGDLDELEVTSAVADPATLHAFAPVLPRAERRAALQHLRARLLPKHTPGLADTAAAAWPARRAQVRAHVADCLGLSPPPAAGALDVQVHGELERDGVRVQRVSWIGFPGQRATGWLWTPAAARSGRHPAMLCPHGHWQHGARDPVVQARCAAFAKFGWTTLAVDSVHVEDIASGVSSIGTMVWHDLRGLQLLRERADVDPARIGVTGASGGGQQTYYLMALSDDFAAAAPMVMACYFAEIVDDTSAHCGCNHPPRLAAGVDVPEMCAVFAPKPAMFGSVAQDWTRHFPEQGLPELAAHWLRLGGPAPRSRFADEPHNYDRPMREVVYGFLHDTLLGPAADGAPRHRVAEPEWAPFPPQALAQLGKDGPNGPPDRAALVAERLARVAKVDALPALAPGLHTTIAPQPLHWLDPKATRWRRGTVTGSDGVPIPFRFDAQRHGFGPQILIDPRGAAVAAAGSPPSGGPLYVIDPRPYGEWAPFRSAWQRNGLLLGRGEAYQAAVDVALLAASLPGDLPVAVQGIGEAGVIALLAAQLCPRIEHVLVDDLGPTFAADGNRLPLCPEIRRFGDLGTLIDALPAGRYKGPRPR
ncbi:MAG: hypothetical protein JNK15_21005 [Planctomycetes bacterium]|nr:hypothetical protein [Planctomycetota bacterium]